MTGLEVVNNICGFLKERQNKNATLYTDLANPEHLHKLQEDTEILEYVNGIFEWRKNG